MDPRSGDPKAKAVRGRVFSIMAERYGTWLSPIPWRVIEPHARTAGINHAQTLERLHQRGGLTPKEALHALKDIRFYDGKESSRIFGLSFADAERELRALVKERWRALVNQKDDAPCNHPELPATLDDRGISKCPKCDELIVGA